MNLNGRAIIKDEVQILRWLLENAAVGDVSAYRAKALDELQARPCCSVCAGLLFGDAKPFNEHLQMLADALAVYPDGQIAGVLLWASCGEFAWLEFHDTFTDGVVTRFPATTDLKTWEQHGSPSL